MCLTGNFFLRFISRVFLLVLVAVLSGCAGMSNTSGQNDMVSNQENPEGQQRPNAKLENTSNFGKCEASLDQKVFIRSTPYGDINLGPILEEIVRASECFEVLGGYGREKEADFVFQPSIINADNSNRGLGFKNFGQLMGLGPLSWLLGGVSTGENIKIMTQVGISDKMGKNIGYFSGSGSYSKGAGYVSVFEKKKSYSEFGHEVKWVARQSLRQAYTKFMAFILSKDQL